MTNGGEEPDHISDSDSFDEQEWDDGGEPHGVMGRASDGQYYTREQFIMAQPPMTCGASFHSQRSEDIQTDRRASSLSRILKEEILVGQQIPVSVIRAEELRWGYQHTWPDGLRLPIGFHEATDFRTRTAAHGEHMPVTRPTAHRRATSSTNASGSRHAIRERQNPEEREKERALKRQAVAVPTITLPLPRDICGAYMGVMMEHFDDWPPAFYDASNQALRSCGRHDLAARNKEGLDLRLVDKTFYQLPKAPPAKWTPTPPPLAHKAQIRWKQAPTPAVPVHITIPETPHPPRAKIQTPLRKAPTEQMLRGVPAKPPPAGRLGTNDTTALCRNAAVLPKPPPPKPPPSKVTPSKSASAKSLPFKAAHREDNRLYRRK